MEEWLREFIKNLPLDRISEITAEVVAWWSEQVKDIPVDELPFQVYVGASLIVCFLWFFVARMLPKPLGGMSWIVVIAVLFTPSSSLGDTGDVAPACIAVSYSVLLKDYHGAAMSGLPILLIIIGGFFLGFIWQILRDTITEINNKKKEAKELMEANETAEDDNIDQDEIPDEQLDVMELINDVDNDSIADSDKDDSKNNNDMINKQEKGNNKKTNQDSPTNTELKDKKTNSNNDDSDNALLKENNIEESENQADIKN